MKRKKDRTGAGGVAIVTAIVNLDMEWIYRPQDHPGTDYGIDAQFEVTDDEGVETGRLIGVQVKSGQSHFREKAPEGFIHRPSERHVRYWEAYGLPVILVFVDPKTRTAYWVLHRECREDGEGLEARRSKEPNARPRREGAALRDRGRRWNGTDARESGGARTGESAASPRGRA